MTGNAETLTSIGRYQLIAEIGRGGMSNVYLAIMRGMAGFDRLVVVKILHDMAANTEEMKQFMSEAQLVSRLNHPNVVQSHEVGEENGRFYIAMEYLEGQPMSRISRPGASSSLPLLLHVRALSDVLSALHYAHELTDYDGTRLGIIHRDVSPQNVFITYDGVVKLLDFGIAKSAAVDHETRAGVIKGKIGYLAPEQLSSARVTQKVDIFAVGVMLWEAISGRRFWEGLSEYEILLKLAKQEIPSVEFPGDKTAGAEALTQICARALNPNPDVRFATALEFRAALEEYLSAFTSRASSATLSRYMGERFAGERRNMRTIIQQRLAQLQPADGSSASALPVTLPTLSSMRMEGTMTGTASCNSRLIKQTTSARYALTAEPSLQPDQIPSQSTKRTWLIAGAAVAVLATAAFIGRQRATAPQVVAAAAPATVFLPAETRSAQDGPREAPTAAEIRLIASPPNARLFVDNAPLPDNPYIGRFARNMISHQVRAEADGYVARTELVTFDADRIIKLELSKSASGATAGPRAPMHPGKLVPVINGRPRTDGSPSQPIDIAPAAPAPKPAPVQQPQGGRDLDEVNPYRGPSAPPKRIDETNPFH